MSERDIFLSQCIAIDTETTGKDYKTAEVIHLGIADKNGMRGEFFSASIPVPHEVSALTHISNRMVQDKPIFTQAAIESFMPVNYNNYTYIAHNSFYDQQVLERYGFGDANWICSLKLAKKIYSENRLHNLPYLRYFLGIDVSEELISHRADVDALVTFKAFEIMLTELENSGDVDKNQPYLPQLLAIMNAPVIMNKMPFGKHKGKLLKEIPLSYWQWAFENMDALNPEAENYDADFAESVRVVLSAVI